ncbi:hypothetical protein [Zavarzinella formosa]|uniref:hypothetical protein n=1 Tax=Zavarzinella formosa TaxID=360055 RepID=UPI0002FCA453|nr:hypothetical protein [Zavarzinella formosa]
MRNVAVIVITTMLVAVTGRAAASEGQAPEAARRHLQEAFGKQFVVFRGKVQEELVLSDEQKKKVEDELEERLRDGMKLFQKLEGLGQEEREKELAEYRPKVREKLAAFLKATLKEDQLKRLRQIELQLEGAFALGQPEIRKELQITDEQVMKFMAVVKELQKTVEPLMKEARSGGNPEEIRPKVMKIRKEHEGKIEALLTDAQKKQWQEMLGKAVSLDD